MDVVLIINEKAKIQADVTRQTRDAEIPHELVFQIKVISGGA